MGCVDGGKEVEVWELQWTYHLDQDYDSKRIILRNIMTTMYYLEEDYDN